MKLSSDYTRYATTFATAVSIGIAFALYNSLSAHTQTQAIIDSIPSIDAAIAQKDWTSVLKKLDAHIVSNPHNVQAKFKRATLLARLDHDDDAIEAFTELTQMYPELPEPYNNLATLYAKHGRYDEARIALETAIKTNPSYGFAYENLGDLYLHLANVSYRRAQILGHTNPVIQQRIVDLAKIIAPLCYLQRKLPLKNDIAHLHRPDK